jgi:uncharacterized iron-regulated membrane protein
METDGYTDFDALKDMAMKLEVRVGGLLVGLRALWMMLGLISTIVVNWEG